ncbi:MAG: hypothetical protein KF795_28600 [Labilithrix sp.]|nr:hypothetical protein [Labilithrix sp.]
MPILRNPQRGGAPASADAGASEGDVGPVEESGEYRVSGHRHETTRVWGGRPVTPATLRSMTAVRPGQPGPMPAPRASSANIEARGATPASVSDPRGALAEGHRRASGTLAAVHHAPREVASAPSRDGGPRRTGTLKMHAVRPFEDATPPPSGRMLDDLDFLGSEHPPVALELGALPAGHVAQETMAGGKLPRSVRFTPQPMEAVKAPPSGEQREAGGGRDAAASSGRTQVSSLELEALAMPMEAVLPVALPRPIDPRPGIVAFAGFGIVPDKLTDLPAYALHVLARKRVLRDGLAIARARRPQDVELYEAALACADDESVNKGLGLVVAVFVAGLAAFCVAVAVIL